MKNVFTSLVAILLIAGCSTTPAPKAPAEIDFGDFTSQTLTTNAWLALDDANYEHAIVYAEKCIELYEGEARRMQASLDMVPHIDVVHSYWALNDVGTSYFIKGEALIKLYRKPEALESFVVVRDDLFYAQTWDPKGWFWRPATASYSRIEMLSEDF